MSVAGCGADPGSAEGSGEGSGEGSERSAAPDPCRPEPDADSPRDPTARLCAVADAWQGSVAARGWAEEFHPLDPVVRLPAGVPRDETDALAYRNGAFRAATPLPEEPWRGEVRWENGDSAELSLISAADAFGELDSGIDDGSPGFHALEVTGVEQGEMELRTSRGPARVPAWLLTLDGYDTPLRYAAVALPEPPAAPVDPVSHVGDEGELVGLDSVAEVSEDGRRVTVAWQAGSCERVDFDVLETDESVVIAATVAGGPPPGVQCTAEMRPLRETLDLERPLGQRAPLDAVTGEVLQPELTLE